ncbi:hypothetical protein ACI1US_00404 [Leucobacter sp. BZR 635]
MTSSEPSRFHELRFSKADIEKWTDARGRHQNWPVVYVIHDRRRIYIGETTRARSRFRQHLEDPDKAGLNAIRVVINEEFNKSACLDLEARLISWFHADGVYSPLNRNDGQQRSSYFEQHTRYQAIFDEVFNALNAAGYFTRSIDEIESLNIFRLSPFKTLNDEQLVAVSMIVEGLFADIASGTPSTSVVQGGPGTGKTILAIYLLKLLRDIQLTTHDPDPEDDGRFNEFFVSGYREALAGARIGFVVPQQSLRKTIQSVFKQTPGLRGIQVLSPYTIAGKDEHWDLLVVDEAHRLTHRGSGTTRGMFNDRNKLLFGDEHEAKTAVDWIIARSDHQVFLVDGEQTVRPADVPAHVTRDLVSTAKNTHRHYSLESQMRVAAGDEYLDFVQRLFTSAPVPARVPDSYDLRFFDDLAEMREVITEREREHGLSRLVAGYAWKWAAKNNLADDAPYDIELDGVQLRWNRTDTDWIASPTSPEEVGSVHTVQGYDLNYAGVIIGPDIVWDEELGRVRAIRTNHFDTEVRSVRDEQALLEYVRNAYYVLLTRGMRGTYVYVCDPALRMRLRTLFEQ